MYRDILHLYFPQKIFSSLIHLSTLLKTELKADVDNPSIIYTYIYIRLVVRTLLSLHRLPPHIHTPPSITPPHIRIPHMCFVPNIYRPKKNPKLFFTVLECYTALYKVYMCKLRYYTGRSWSIAQTWLCKIAHSISI